MRFSTSFAWNIRFVRYNLAAQKKATYLYRMESPLVRVKTYCRNLSSEWEKLQSSTSCVNWAGSISFYIWDPAHGSLVYHEKCFLNLLKIYCHGNKASTFARKIFTSRSVSTGVPKKWRKCHPKLVNCRTFSSVLAIWWIRRRPNLLRI